MGADAVPASGHGVLNLATVEGGVYVIEFTNYGFWHLVLISHTAGRPMT